MLFLELAVAVLTLIGVLLPFTLRKETTEFAAAPTPTGTPYLLAFAAVVVVFGILSGFYYREFFRSHFVDAMFVIWLGIAMIAGMFAQVLASNYRAGHGLFDISRDRLLFPLLFSIIVFYPIWAVAASAPKGFFVIHAAFLNGYFWESIVSGAKPPSRANRT